MRLRHRDVALALAAVVTLGTGCERRGDGEASVRTPTVNEMARAGQLVLGDSQVVQAMRAPRAPGRIIYEPPVDLSLTNATRTRPDLVGAAVAGPDTGRAGTRRDTTAGDATVDTSGGAARRRRP